MLSRFTLAFSVLASSAAVVACGAIGEHLSVGGNALEGSDADASDATDAPGDLLGDACDFQPGVPTCPRIPIYETDFEGPDECAAWTATDGVVTTVSGQVGNGCMICATKPVEQMYMARRITLPTVATGIYRIEYFAKRVTGDDQPSAVGGMFFIGIDGPTPLPLFGGGTASPTWYFGGPSRAIWVAHGEAVVELSLGAATGWGSGTTMAAGDCVAFDGVRVTLVPASLPPEAGP